MAASSEGDGGAPLGGSLRGCSDAGGDWIWPLNDSLASDASAGLCMSTTGDCSMTAGIISLSSSRDRIEGRD